MNKYKVYFQWLGKKQAMIIEADSEMKAENIVLNKLQIDEVKLIEGTEPKPTKENMFADDNLDSLKSIFGFK